MLKKGHHFGQHKSIQAFVVAVFNKLNELNYQCDAENRKGHPRFKMLEQSG